MRIFITGATGSIGRRLVADRVRRGDKLRLLSRDREYAKSVFAGLPAHAIDFIEGDATRAGAWQLALDGCGTVIHLAGAGIAERRWSTRRMRELRESRVESSRRLVEAISRASHRPRVLIAASGVHATGDRPGEVVTERTDFGRGFLAELCRDWEASVSEVRHHGVRAVPLRIPMVIDPDGPAMRELTTWARRGVVPWIGPPRRATAWIHHQDLVAIFSQAIEDPSLDGVILATAPKPVGAREFAEHFARVHCRAPRPLQVPRLLARIALGPIAGELAAEVDARPLRLLARSFEWRFPSISDALADALGPESGRVSSPSPRPATPARPRAVIIDLDHDALDAHGALLASSEAALRAARASVALVPATRRPAAECPACSHAVFQGSPALVAGGSVLLAPVREGCDPIAPRLATIPTTLLARLLGDIAELDPSVGVIFERADGYATPHLERLRAVRRGRALPHAEPRELIELVTGETLRLHLCDDIHGLDIVERWLRDRYASAGLVRLSHPSQGILTVAAAASDLAHRRAEIAEFLGISEAETAHATSLADLGGLARGA